MWSKFAQIEAFLQPHFKIWICFGILVNGVCPALKSYPGMDSVEGDEKRSFSTAPSSPGFLHVITSKIFGAKFCYIEIVC